MPVCYSRRCCLLSRVETWQFATRSECQGQTHEDVFHSQVIACLHGWLSIATVRCRSDIAASRNGLIPLFHMHVALYRAYLSVLTQLLPIQSSCMKPLQRSKVVKLCGFAKGVGGLESTSDAKKHSKPFQ